MISFRSSEVCFSPRSRGSTPNRRTIAFETLVSAIVNGALSDLEPVQRPRQHPGDAGSAR